MEVESADAARADTSGVVGFVLSFCVAVAENDNVVCRTTFESASLPGVTLVCFVLCPRRGDGALPLPLPGLRRLGFLDIVNCSRSRGTVGT